VDGSEDVHEGARALARRGASRGGRARADRLSAEERKEIARRAAQARWGSMTLAAPHMGDLQIGGRKIACAVLEDDTRVVNQGTLLTALNRSRTPKSGDAGKVLFAANLQPYISPRLAESLRQPIAYIMPGGARALGYKAEILPEICEVYLDARKDGRLFYNQQPAADAAEILVRGLARVGIVALIDEATGYQEVRARHELQRILEAYVQAELRRWTKTFPDEFFKEIYRLQGWEYRPGTSKRTPFVGTLINKYVYGHLPPGVLDELRRRNPRTEKGYRAYKHFQFLTLDTGDPHLNQQISTVTTLMRIARSKEEFEDLFERAFPPPEPRLPLVIEVAATNSGSSATFKKAQRVAEDRPNQPDRPEQLSL
jgi:hypothetical protein